MDPITWAIVGGSAIAGAGATKATVNYMGAQAQAGALRSQARSVESGAEREIAGRTKEALQFASTQRLRATSAGVDLSGSPAMITAETLATAAIEAEDTRRQAAMQAGQLRRQAKKAETAGNIGLAADIIGTVGSLAMLGFSAAASSPASGSVVAPAAGAGPTAAPATGALQGQLPPWITPGTYLDPSKPVLY